jgi:CRP-like cAMP-binding protein
VQTKTYSKGDVIFREGDESSEAYRIVSGDVEISIDTRGGARRVARLPAGELFGEMSLIDDKPRSATAAALTDCEVEVIHEENFTTRVLGDPDNLHLYLRTLFDRLRATDSLLRWHINKASPAGHPKASVEAALHGVAAQAPSTVSGADAPARLRLTSTSDQGKKTDVAVTKIPFRIGRATQGGHGFSPLTPNDLSIPDQKPYHVSRNHCVIERSGDNFLVRDLGSRLGTVVNGTPLGIEFEAFVAPLKPGENTVVLGDNSGPHHFRVEVL